jgi:hypothetical protein
MLSRKWGWVMAALVGTGAGAQAQTYEQTDQGIWPTGTKGTKTWPREIPNSFSKAPNWTFPEGGDVPPDNLFERIKCPDGSAKEPITKFFSARWETSRWHPPEYAFDKYTVSRWSSWDKNANWLTADLNGEKTVKRVYLLWETAYGKDYDIKIGNDTASLTVAKQVRGGNGMADVHEVEGKGKYLQMWGVAGGSGYGYSLYELTICTTEGGTSIQPKQKSWGLMMGKDGLPQGVRAVDATGKAVGGGRKLPYSNLFVVPDAR